MNQYMHIGSFLQHLTRTHQFHICIKDYIGFIPINHALDEVLEPYVAHTNPYCMFVKQELKQYHRCLSMIRPMYNKCFTHPEGFCGMCHAGVYECIVPITLRGEMLGSINIGCLPGKERESAFLRRRLFRGVSGAAYEQAEQLFAQYMQPPRKAVEDILPSLFLLAEYLAQTYISCCQIQAGPNKYQLPRINLENTVISHAVEYIHQYYASRITVEQVAHYCHCSASYISHIFHKRTGLTMNTYINKVRIEHAKNLLLTSAVSISDVAISVGFSDPNYFSRVFTRLLDIPPREFRRRYTT